MELFNKYVEKAFMVQNLEYYFDMKQYQYKELQGCVTTDDTSELEKKGKNLAKIE